MKHRRLSLFSAFMLCCFLFLLIPACKTAVPIAENTQPSPPPEPADTTLVTQADEAINAGNFGKATELLLQVLEKEPKNVTALYNLAIIAELQQKPDEAARLYGEVLAIDEKDAAALGGLGWIAFQKYEYQKSLDLSLKAVENNPQLLPARMNSGLAQVALGDLEKAMTIFQEATLLDKSGTAISGAMLDLVIYIKTHPQATPLAWYPLAFFYRVTNQQDKEREALDTFLEQVPDQPEFRLRAEQHRADIAAKSSTEAPASGETSP